MMKRFALYLCILLMMLSLFAVAEDNPHEYVGNMEVVNCNEWVSLREYPRTNAKRLVKVSLGAIVHDCYAYSDEWYYAEFDGYSGYILAEYLEPSDGRITFNAMMTILPDEGTPFYAVIDGEEPLDYIPTNTIVRNCSIMDNNRIYVEWGSRCGFIDLMHAEVYNEMMHYPQQITLHTNLYGGGVVTPSDALKIVDLNEFPILEYDYNIYEYEEFMKADSEDLPKVKFVLYTDTTVSKVHLFSVSMEDWDTDTGDVTYEAVLEDIQYYVDADHPLCVGAVIWGDMPNLAVGYEDENCVYHFVFVEISGEDGSLLLREF